MEIRWRVPKHPSLHQKNYTTDADLRPMYLTWKRWGLGNPPDNRKHRDELTEWLL